MGWKNFGGLDGVVLRLKAVDKNALLSFRVFKISDLQKGNDGYESA